MRKFLPAQSAFLKLNLITLIEQKHLYGLELSKEIRTLYKGYHYQPNSPEVYKALHELIEEGVLYQSEKKLISEVSKRKKESPVNNENNPAQGTKKGFQKVIYYDFAADGRNKAKVYKKLMKEDLDRSIALLQEALKFNY